jgi:hypothetical protein
MVSDPDDTRAHTPEIDHEELKARTERARIAWAETSEGTEPTKRAQKKLRDGLRQYTALASAKLIDLMLNGESHTVQLGAVKEFYDRAFGKAKEHIEIDATTDQAAAIAAELAQLRQRPETAKALLTLAEASAALNAKKRD